MSERQRAGLLRQLAAREIPDEFDRWPMIRRRIAGDPFPIQQGARSIEVTISIGIAALGMGEDAAAVLKRADQALYRAKRDGRNRVVPDAA